MHTLLLADENNTVQRVIALTFAGEPIQVVSVGDGQQAIDRMAATRPDIVLAGTTVPTVSGYDLAKFMRSKTELRDVPVLLLAGAFETVDEMRLASSGASGIIEKPVEPTTLIGRVKELLGLTSDEKPATPVGRTITVPGDPKDEKKLPVATPPRAVTNTRGGPTKWEQLRNQSGLEPDAKSVEDSSTRPDNYLDTLDAAFDSLDQQLSGRAATSKRPSGEPVPAGVPIVEADDDWFGDTESQARADARAGRREIAEDLSDPALQAPAAPAAHPVFEVDDEWFKEDEQARAAKLKAQRELATEMGVHDVDLPEKNAAAVAAPGWDLDFDAAAKRNPEPAALAAIEPVAPLPMPTSPIIPASALPGPSEPGQQRAIAVSGREEAPINQVAAPAPPLMPPAPAPEIRVVAPEITPDMLDQIASKLAPPQITAEMLDRIASHVAPPQITEAMLDHIASRVPPPVITADMLGQIAAGVPAPQISTDMLDQIASRVADRLIASTFGEHLREQIVSTLRDTVRSVVSETSERLVREEIDRIKNKR